MPLESSVTLQALPLSTWPSDERPREKLHNAGVEHLSDAELLAILLRSGVAGMDAVTLARSLLQKAGDLQRLATRPLSWFTRHPGIGPAKAAQLLAGLELSRRCAQPTPNHCMRSARHQVLYAYQKLRNLQQERLLVIGLNRRFQWLGSDVLFQGTLDHATIYPRELVQHTLNLGSYALVLAHNHPSGNPMPSAADRSITHQLATLLLGVGVKLLEHWVIGDDQAYGIQGDVLLTNLSKSGPST